MSVAMGYLVEPGPAMDGDDNARESYHERQVSANAFNLTAIVLAICGVGLAVLGSRTHE